MGINSVWIRVCSGQKERADRLEQVIHQEIGKSVSVSKLKQYNATYPTAPPQLAIAHLSDNSCDAFVGKAHTLGCKVILLFSGTITSSAEVVQHHLWNDNCEEVSVGLVRCSERAIFTNLTMLLHELKEQHLDPSDVASILAGNPLSELALTVLFVLQIAGWKWEQDRNSNIESILTKERACAKANTVEFGLLSYLLGFNTNDPGFGTTASRLNKSFSSVVAGNLEVPVNGQPTTIEAALCLMKDSCDYVQWNKRLAFVRKALLGS